LNPERNWPQLLATGCGYNWAPATWLDRNFRGFRREFGVLQIAWPHKMVTKCARTFWCN